MIRYSYLWARESEDKRAEGVKDRPCAIVVAILRPNLPGPLVRVLPITHSPPVDPRAALELPQSTKQRLGLDDERSWIVLSECNDFVWPGPDLRPSINGDLATVAHGILPPNFLKILKARLLERIHAKRFKTVSRTK